MRIFIALLAGIALGAAGLWYFSSDKGQKQIRNAGDEIGHATKTARDTVQEKLQVMSLRPQDIKEELGKTGQVVRRKARDAGQAIADATADARITATIKGKLVADSRLSALRISVNTTAGVVTLSGTVASPDDIGHAMVVAMDVEGVREVVSTLQVQPAAGK